MITESFENCFNTYCTACFYFRNTIYRSINPSFDIFGRRLIAGGTFFVWLTQSTLKNTNATLALIETEQEQEAFLTFVHFLTVSEGCQPQPLKTLMLYRYVRVSIICICTDTIFSNANNRYVHQWLFDSNINFSISLPCEGTSWFEVLCIDSDGTVRY